MKKRIGIVGFPQDIGASRRGVDMGPFAMRAVGLVDAVEALGYEVKDYGNVPCLGMGDVLIDGEKYSGDDKLRFLHPILHNVQALKKRVELIVDDGALPVIIGGDHSQAIGSVAGLQKKFGADLGVLWVDAHGDFNTVETTPSGNIHGMPLSVICGRGDRRLLDVGPFPGARERNVAVFGARDLDPGEIENLRASEVTVVSTADILEEGFRPSIDRAIDAVCDGVDRVHVSFDMDSIDPMFCPGTGNTVPGGLTSREVLYLMERMHATGKVCSIDLVEVNPALDHQNRTGEFAVELVCRALGKKTRM